jgi:hypothetical protein
MSYWGNDTYGDCVSAEEWWAKAVYPIWYDKTKTPLVMSSQSCVQWAFVHGYLFGADLTSVMDSMASSGPNWNGTTYTDGPYVSVDYTNRTTLCSAIFQGPVKLGVAAGPLQNVVNGANGWFLVNAGKDTNYDHCIGVWGYGTSSSGKRDDRADSWPVGRIGQYVHAQSEPVRDGQQRLASSGQTTTGAAASGSQSIRSSAVGLLADIQAITSDSAELATDQAAVVTAQNNLQAAQQQVAADQAAVTAADQQLSADLQALNGQVVVVADTSTTPPTYSIYQYSPNPPGFVIYQGVTPT